MRQKKKEIVKATLLGTNESIIISNRYIRKSYTLQKEKMKKNSSDSGFESHLTSLVFDLTQVNSL